MTEETMDTFPPDELEAALPEDLDQEKELDKEEALEQEEAREGNTITFKRSHLYAVLLPLAFAVGLSVGYLFWGRDVPPAATAAASGTGGTSGQAQASASDQSQAVRRYDVPVDDDPILGPENAPITVIEFSDFECPYCRRWHEEVYSRLLENYPDQVRIVYRDFPLDSIHRNATPAALAANCAYEQNAFWEYHDKLFGGELGLGADAYEQYAQELGLDMASFDECLQSDRYLDEVRADLQWAANLGVQSTPTFFINGIALVGAQPYEVFQQVIDSELAGEIP